MYAYAHSHTMSNALWSCSHLKDPILPIWVVCSESHFTVLYEVDSHHRQIPSTASGTALTLMYYDGLANQEQPIKLTVGSALPSTAAALAKHDQTSYGQQSSDDALVPPLEHVLHTKWPKATVHWNGSEPIL